MLRAIASYVNGPAIATWNESLYRFGLLVSHSMESGGGEKAEGSVWQRQGEANPWEVAAINLALERVVAEGSPHGNAGDD
ncbi:hypothetical protein [Rhizobium favelukesii]|uniref:hypothetical protein n=1 Tax=Rhizobium favelukesii TaxID=348824 RepID=UPI0011478DEE|nr:hypothetical protein [Rhizobium favelukesii]